MANRKIDAIPDKITLKVKLAQEDYHDLVIDMSDESGPFKGKQVINQLSSITRIPLYYINLVWILYTAEDSVFMLNVRDRQSNSNTDELTKGRCAANFHNGDCFALETQMHYLQEEFKFNLILYCHGLFDEFDCTFEYCRYHNTRPFLNRQISIATDSELLMIVRTRMEEARGVINYFDQLMEIFSDLSIRHFTFNSITKFCRSRNHAGQSAIDLPRYTRARG